MRAQALAVSRVAVLPQLDAATYQRHALHADDRVWVEKNCYVDIWIEVVHALGLEPMAMLPFVVAHRLRGRPVDVLQAAARRAARALRHRRAGAQRVAAARSSTRSEHLGAGKLDLDRGRRVLAARHRGHRLPAPAHQDDDRASSDFDRRARRLGYFHNAGYYALEGEDFAQTVPRRTRRPIPTFMPLFAELVRIDRAGAAAGGRAARDVAARCSRRHLARRPADNPVARFGAALRARPAVAPGEGLRASITPGRSRRCASSARRSSSLALYLRVARRRRRSRRRPTRSTRLSQTAKAFILKAARAVNAKRALDAAPMFDEMAAAWQSGHGRAARARAA